MTEPTVHVRAYPAQIKKNGPRQLTGRLVPYNVATDVLDMEDDGQPDLYREGFRPGAFASQLNSTSKGVIRKISLIHRHEGGLGFLGPFVALREQPDGLYGDVNIVPTKAEDVGALIQDGIDELSIEFHLIGRANHTEVDGTGVRWRTRAYLHQVALEPKGAYSQAQVLAYRAAIDEEQKEQAEANAAEQAKLAREKAEQEEAEDQRLREEAEAAAVRVRTEAEAEATLERRRRWEELTARVPKVAIEQAELVRIYGIPRPG
jgi:HK97 family phage prohead protease